MEPQAHNSHLVSVNQFQYIAQLTAQPVCKYRVDSSHIFYATSDHTISLFDINSQSFPFSIPTSHAKRINCIRTQTSNNLLTSCSNDSSIKLWDTKSNPIKPVHQFKRNRQQFTSLASSKHILAAGADGKIVFYDLRKMKERSTFGDSFNGEVTGLHFDIKVPTKLYGCSTDGLVNCFDLTQDNEEDAAVWLHRLDNPAESMQVYQQQDLITVHTVDNTLVMLKQETLVKKYAVNSADEPKTLLQSYLRYSASDLSFYVWNKNEETVEKYDKECNVVMNSIGATDVDFMDEITHDKILLVDGHGGLRYADLVEYNPFQKFMGNCNMEVESSVSQSGVIKPDIRSERKKRYFDPLG